MKSQGTPVVAFKTVQPSLDGTIDRPGALASLHTARARARWLAGPSGSGKSTLVAQCARERTVAWYRIDARDEDPAYFYASLSAAADAAFPPIHPLPAFTDEDHANEAGFAARFFAAMAARCAGGVVVFDDVHKATRASLAQALARFVVTAADVDVWLVGEEPPTPAFFDAIASRRLAICNDVRLAFDAEECAKLAHEARVVHIDGRALAGLTGGHAGAVVLACEMLRLAHPGPDTMRAVDEMHLHLLTRLLDAMAPARRDLLLQTAFAPQFSRAMASALAGDEAAAQIDPLHAQGLLQRANDPRMAVYEAHGLVRRGAQSLLRARLGDSAVQALVERTAGVLASHGYDDDAFDLLIGHARFARAATLLAPLAERYARNGQAALLARAVARLPAAEVDERPWLCFWTGEALLGIDEEAARAWFERAHDSFDRAGDADGRRVAAARVITAFGLEYADVRTLDTWMRRYEHAGGDDPVAAGAVYETALCLGAICAAIVRGAYPEHYDAEALLNRVRTLMDQSGGWLTADEPVAAARLLIDDARIFRGPERAQAMVTATRAIAEGARGALQRGRWCISAAWAFIEDGRHDVAAEHFALAAALVEQTASKRLAFELGMARVNAALKLHALDEATERLAALEQLARAAPPAQRAEYERFAARVMLQSKRAHEGLRWAEQALATARLAGYSGTHTRIFQLECIYGLAACERLDEAAALARTTLEGLDDRQADAARVLADALDFMRAGATDHVLLARTFERAAGIGFVNLFARVPAVAGPLCAAALAHDIEPAFVRRMIASQALDPPPLTGPQWPWPVKVRTLGAFALTIGDAPYRPSHKSQDKPLELLKLLVACQALGRDSADKDWVAERLWPDADAANARKSVDMTVSRLRRLLHDDDAVTSADGRLALAGARVWTDVHLLLAALASARARRDASVRGHAVDVEGTAAEIAAVLEHFAGPFLPDDAETPWVLSAREAVATAVRAALLIADTLLDGRDDARLVPALERAFAADPTSEDLARALMRARARAGQSAEVLRVYRRLRDMLSIVLGVAPSEETQRLHQAMMNEAHAGGASGQAAQMRVPLRP